MNICIVEKRMESIYENDEKGIIRLDMLFDSDNVDYIGYCLSSIEDTLGKIESIQ